MNSQEKQSENTDIFTKKDIVLIISLFFSIFISKSLITNIAQSDDAWIPDAMMFLAIGIVIFSLFRTIFKHSLISQTKTKDTPPPDFELYKVSAIGIASFWGTMFAGGILLSKNFKRLGKESEARISLIYSTIAIILSIIIGLIIPHDWYIRGIAFYFCQFMAMLYIAKYTQGNEINKHIKHGGTLASNWKAFGISLLVLIAILIVRVSVAVVLS